MFKSHGVVHTHEHPIHTSTYIHTRMCTNHIHICTRNLLPKVIGIGQLKQFTLEKHAMHTSLRHLKTHLPMCLYFPTFDGKVVSAPPLTSPSNEDFQLLSKSKCGFS